MNMNEFDIIVVGAGHAGCEAAYAAAKLGQKVLFLTMSVDKIAAMSCNPAIGGTAKGHLVKEIDALDGLMGKMADAAGIQFRVLNRTKGPAIWSSRAQVDMSLYSMLMKDEIEKVPGIHLRQDKVKDLIIENGHVVGVRTGIFGDIRAKNVILTSGTFLNGLIHIGEQRISAGRFGDPAAKSLPDSLNELGLEVGRLKTGTTPRLDGKTIEWGSLEVQHSDENIIPFSFMNHKIKQELLPCYITQTNTDTHQVILDDIKKSPVYNGSIAGKGPRYCPSIEDKVMRFPDRQQHQIFLEPQGYKTCEIYPNGISTSLPLETQLRFIRSIKGLEKAEIIRPGYAIEYDFVQPTELDNCLKVKSCKGLYLAGQINGTTGYEEAASQGLIAGINAALENKGSAPFILSRSEAYIGVLVDDLVTKGTKEPYRMFTSRAEHRLKLREDNADERLTPRAIDFGICSDERKTAFEDSQKRKVSLEQFIYNTKLGSRTLPKELSSMQDNPGTTLSKLVSRPSIHLTDLVSLFPELDAYQHRTKHQVETKIKYAGYIERQEVALKKLEHLDNIKIPKTFTYDKISGLSNEVVEKLTHIAPRNLGQASRISGVTPAAIQLLEIQLKNPLHQH